MEQNKKEERKELFFQVFWYVVIFSVIGLVIETLYCYFTTGILESRKGLLWGPFCPVYGVGGAVIILTLNKFKDSKWKLFLFGIILGGIIEYVLSYILEAIYGIRFWEYSYLYSNLNGRICLTYSIFWGILSVFLIKWIKPEIDRLIEKIPYKNTVRKILLLLLSVDIVITIWAVNTYENRAKGIYKESKIDIINKVEKNYFTNTRMKTIFPNLRIITETGEEVFVRDIIEN